jgi:hypothetical protein
LVFDGFPGRLVVLNPHEFDQHRPEFSLQLGALGIGVKRADK